MTLDRHLASTASAVDALVGGSVDRVDALGALSTDEFLELARRIGELARIVDAFGALTASEITRRVQTDAAFRRAALGGDVGGRLASELLRDLAHVGDATLRSWEQVGDAITPRTSLQGEVLPSRHEPVAEAVLGARITASHAAVVVAGVDRVADHADAAALDQVEATLVEYAGSLTTRQLVKLARTLPERFDPDGAEPREELLRARSKVTVRQLPDGLTRITADLHPVAAGLFTTALDAHTAPRRQVAFTPDPDGSDHVIDDTRPLTQRRVDALETILRDALRHDTGTMAGTAVTMLVTVPLDSLVTGLGTARVAGIDEPIAASTARRLAAEAELIPVMLGGASEVLDLGRSSRLFSEAQRRAMIARDGGCVWPACQAPPSWCEAAHLRPWLSDGPTDLHNGALMCSAHHHRFDRDGWALHREDGTPYLIPPPWLDPTRTPRRAGRLPQLAHVH